VKYACLQAVAKLTTKMLNAIANASRRGDTSPENVRIFPASAKSRMNGRKNHLIAARCEMRSLT